MAHALPLKEIANQMLSLGLAIEDRKICVIDALNRASEKADRSALLAIARVLLQVSPPKWLAFAVRNEQVFREYVPTQELEKLRWIEPELDQVLLDARSVLALREDVFLKAMGDVAELFVLAALEHAGANAVHVSKISDSYGYDIECFGKMRSRVEVKAAGPVTAPHFHISRNEFEKSCRYGDEWCLVQVIFSSRAFVSKRLDHSHIDCVRRLCPGVLQNVVPVDSAHFKWVESARISTVTDHWHTPDFALDPTFSTSGFYLGTCASA